MTANRMLQDFLDKSPWVDPKHTVDGVKFGSGDRDITRVGVGWMPSIENLRAAHEDGRPLFVTHEPTFWQHTPEEKHFRTEEPGIAKSRFLEEADMAVLRFHDTWDNWPEIGIRDSWARFLGLDRFVAEAANRWHAVYEIAPVPLEVFAKRVAAAVRKLGEDSVQVMGDPKRIVSRPSVGVGCGGPDRDMVELGSDVLIVCFDGASYWHARQRFAELGAAVICLEHGTTEMPGIENMAKYIAETYPELDVGYYDRHPRPWTVMAEEDDRENR